MAETTQQPANTTPQPSQRRFMMTLIGVVIVTVLVTGVVTFVVLKALLPQDPPPTDVTSFVAASSQNGVRTLTPARTVQNFTMTSHTGEPVSLADLQGDKVLLSFGYTHCPDVCPLTVNEFKSVRDQLGDKADDVRFVFVSVDGERDTPEAMYNFFRVRNAQDFVIGLSGDDATLNRIRLDYNLFYERVENPNLRDGNYDVNHTANIYLIDEEGRMTNIFAFGTPADVIAETVLAQFS